MYLLKIILNAAALTLHAWLVHVQISLILLLNERIQIKNKYFWLCNPYEGKVRPVFPESESLKCVLLNERIQIENEYSILM